MVRLAAAEQSNHAKILPRRSYAIPYRGRIPRAAQRGRRHAARALAGSADRGVGSTRTRQPARGAGARALRRSPARHRAGRRGRPLLGHGHPPRPRGAAGGAAHRGRGRGPRGEGDESRRGGFPAQIRPRRRTTGALDQGRAARTGSAAGGDLRRAASVPAHAGAGRAQDRRAGKDRRPADSGLSQPAQNRRRRHGAGVPCGTRARWQSSCTTWCCRG